MDSNEEDVTEKNNIHKIYEYDDNSVNDNCDDKPLIVTTEVLGCQWYEDGGCLLWKNFVFLGNVWLVSFFVNFAFPMSEKIN